MRASTVCLVFVTTALSGCIRGQSPAPVPDRNLISFEEIERAANANTAWDLVKLLRPRFLQVRGANKLPRSNGRGSTSRSAETEEDLPVVYLDRIRYGAASRLSEIDISRIHEIRFIEATQAETLYGSGLLRGVIEVTTRIRAGTQGRPTVDSPA